MNTTLETQLPAMDESKAKWEARINKQRARITATEAEIEALTDKLLNQRKHLHWLGAKLSESQTYLLNLEGE